MTDKLLDSTQLISGAAILLSFFVGYKYGLRNNSKPENETASANNPAAEKVRVKYNFTAFF